MPFNRIKYVWNNKERDALIVAYSKVAQDKGQLLEKQYPGIDWTTILFDGLYRAAYNWQPEKSSFYHYFLICIRSEVSDGKKKWNGRRKLLKNKGLTIERPL